MNMIEESRTMPSIPFDHHFLHPDGKKTERERTFLSFLIFFFFFFAELKEKESRRKEKRAGKANHNTDVFYFLRILLFFLIGPHRETLEELALLKSTTNLKYMKRPVRRK